MKKVIIIPLILICINLSGQLLTQDEIKVFEATDIIFYGYDFSHFKLAEGKRLNDDIVSYVASWIGYMHNKKNEENLEYKLAKEYVKFDFDYTVGLIKDLNSKDLVSPIKSSIPFYSIQGIINNYKYEESEGVGFVVIVECFEKSTETASAYFVFFDIASKNVLMSDRISDKKTTGRGYGMTNYWGVGIDSMFDKYLRSIYRDTRYEYNMFKNEEAATERKQKKKDKKK